MESMFTNRVNTIVAIYGEYTMDISSGYYCYIRPPTFNRYSFFTFTYIHRSSVPAQPFLISCKNKTFSTHHPDLKSSYPEKVFFKPNINITSLALVSHEEKAGIHSLKMMSGIPENINQGFGKVSYSCECPRRTSGKVSQSCKSLNEASGRVSQGYESLKYTSGGFRIVAKIQTRITAHFRIPANETTDTLKLKIQEQ